MKTGNALTATMATIDKLEKAVRKPPRMVEDMAIAHWTSLTCQASCGSMMIEALAPALTKSATTKTTKTR